jgi:hypothetical protein
VRISISCGPFTEKNTVEIEKQQSHPRRAQQSRPRRQSAAGLPSYAPHDSKARLQHESTRRDPWRSHVHRTRFDKRRSSSSYRLPMQRGRGARPLVLSLGGLRGILSFSKESIPLYPCSAKRCSPRGTSAAASFALVRKREKRKQKAPAGRGEGFLLCCVCIFRREKITSGGAPLCKY